MNYTPTSVLLGYLVNTHNVSKYIVTMETMTLVSRLRYSYRCLSPWAGSIWRDDW